MARLLPFTPFELHGNMDLMEPALLRSIIEPCHRSGTSLADCGPNFSQMVADGRYTQHNSPCYYIFKHSHNQGQAIGIWGLFEGKAMGHENILAHKLRQQDQYREHVGLEGSPVILAYRPNPQLENLLKGWSMGIPDFSHQLGNEIYECWRIVNATEIELISTMFSNLGHFYIADGHHRMTSSAGQPLSAILYSSDQLHIHGYHRLANLSSCFGKKRLLWAIEQCWYWSLIPGGKPYVPDQKRRLGMYLDGKWYQLNLKDKVRASFETSDAQLLEETILRTGLGIMDSSQQDSIAYYADKQLSAMLENLEKDPQGVAFTLYPTTIEDLLNYAENGIILPPKSTWVEPRAPYGMIINQLQQQKSKSHEAAPDR